jgi:hypothetical protein
VIARYRRNATRKIEWLGKLHEAFYYRQIKESKCRLEKKRWLKHLRWKYDDSKRRKETKVIEKIKRRMMSQWLKYLLQNESAPHKGKKCIEKIAMKMKSKWLKYRFVKT